MSGSGGYWAGLVGLAVLVGACAYDLSNPNSGGTDGVSGDSNDQYGDCVPGHTVFCDCGNGLQGVKTCRVNGYYGRCDCDNPVAASPDAGFLDSGGPDAGGTPDTGSSADTGSGSVDTGGNSGGGTPDATNDPIAWTPTCTSGTYWRSGDRGSSNMYPGRDCITCHNEGGLFGGGRGPGLTTAGTVYPTLHEVDDCNGVGGAVVIITSQGGQSYQFTTSGAGNFYRRSRDGNIPVPYTAAVEYQGRRVAMATEQTDLNCATCHTLEGTNDALGRIAIP